MSNDDVLEISGESSSERVTGAECASPVGLCTKGRMTGTISGDYRSVATELTPSSVPGVLYVRATTVVTTPDGELTIEEHAIVNSSPDGFGEHQPRRGHRRNRQVGGRDRLPARRRRLGLGEQRQRALGEAPAQSVLTMVSASASPPTTS